METLDQQRNISPAQVQDQRASHEEDNKVQNRKSIRILLTGGAGYIGSHTLLQLIYEGHEVAVFDNFSNSSPESIRRIKELTKTYIRVYQGDIQNETDLEKAFTEFSPEAVVHFAGLKSVDESNSQPLHYYSQNVYGSIQLLKAMQRNDCKRIVFSSSATVYGKAHYLPFDESHPLQPTNPYGRSKLFIEEIIRDWTIAWKGTSAVCLRYFNPVGASPCGSIGEDPTGVPSNLMPYISKVAIGQLPHLNIFGSDYETRDGTGERDYLHVEDLARAHLAAIELSFSSAGFEAINIGTGHGSTVFELLQAFERACGRAIPYKLRPRREGDVARSLAAVRKAKEVLGWNSKLGIHDMCETHWKWQSRNPDGYGTDSR